MDFEIRNHRLYIDGRPVPFVPSPNVGGRIEPTGILYHFTADHLRPDDSVEHFANPASKVSAHLVIGRDCSVTQMVDLDRAAWHAGPSEWNGRSGCNGFMHGLEVDNPGQLTVRGKKAYAWFGTAYPLEECQQIDGSAWLPYAPGQLDIVEGITRALSAAYPTIVGGAGHEDVALPPGRKNDPGPHFPMSRMLAAIGRRASPSPVAISDVQQRLRDLGYTVGAVDGRIGPQTRSAVRTFQEQNGMAVTGDLDRQTTTVLLSEAAKEMPRAHREELSRDDLARDGSSTVSGTRWVKRAAEGTGAVLVGEAAAADPPAPPVSIEQLPAQLPPTPVIDPAQVPQPDTMIDTLHKSKGLGERALELWQWAQTPRGMTTVAILVLLTAMWALADKIEWRRVIKARLGIDLDR